jgi:hypothetical protein
MKYIIFSFFIVFSSTVLAQSEFAQDMLNLNNAYRALNKNMTINMSATSETGKTRKQTIQLRMKDLSNYYVKSNDTEVLVQNGVRMALNKTQKLVMLDSNSNLKTRPCQYPCSIHWREVTSPLQKKV